jgi:hypothetical protein
MGVPVEFLTDEQAGAYGRFSGLPSRMHLERSSSSTTRIAG